MKWQKEYNLDTRRVTLSDNGEECLVCIGHLQPKDTQSLRFFKHKPGQELKAVLNKENFLGGLDEAMTERLSPQDLIEIIGRRDQFDKANTPSPEE